MEIPAQFNPNMALPDGVELRYTLPHHPNWVSSIVWSPSGDKIASSYGDKTIRLWNGINGDLIYILEGHKYYIRSVAWSPDGQQLASCSEDKTVRLWDAMEGKLLHTLEGHTEGIDSVAWSPDGQQLASCSEDKTVRLWDTMEGKLLRTLEGHTLQVKSVVWSPDGKQLASCSYDKTVRLWDSVNGILLHTLEGQTHEVSSVMWSPDGQHLAFSSLDGTVRLCNSTRGELLYTLKDHTDRVRLVAWSPDGKQLASCSDDGTVRLWDPTNGALLYTLEGHTSNVASVAWSPNGLLLASNSNKGSVLYHDNVYIWRTDTWETLAILTDLTGFVRSAWHPTLPLLATVGQQRGDIAVWQLDLERLLRVASPETIHYRNAKVVLVGDSGVGKSGLGLVLSGQPFIPTESTHGRRIWNFDRQEVSLDEQRSETREMLLWDLAGQPGYRLIHQLHLNEVAVALVVFDAHSETDPFAGVRHWVKALRVAQSNQGSSVLPLKKFLVAARIDRGGIGVGPQRIQAVVRDLGFDGYFATSAKEGLRVNELREEIRKAVDWQRLPRVSSTVLFRRIKQFLLDEKKRAKRLISAAGDLYSTFLRSKEETKDLPTQFEMCIGRVESVGLIKQLSFGKLVLLQPELLDAYASALINFVKDEPDGLGSIPEDQVRAGDFRIPPDERMQDADQEKLLLIAMIEDLLRCELALREEGMLVFPSQSTKEHPDLPDPEGKAAVFTFEGPVLNIYATLAVRLARSGLFKKQDLWKNAVTYTTRLSDGICGMYLHNIREGRSNLTLFFDQSADRETRHTFTEYVHLHLSRRALPASVNVRRVLMCKICNAVISENNIQLRKARKLDWLNCPVCENRLSLVEDVQQGSPHTQEMDQIADSQREHEASQLALQGKIATSDFDVFLCYNSEDKTTIMQIGEQLKELGILPWLDEWELRPGLSWQQQLEKQIKQIKSAAVFVGKKGIGPWQEQEIGVLLNKFVKRRCPVIPVLLQDAPRKPKLPLFLANITWVDFRIQDPDPLQRLLWGITGQRDMENERYRGEA